MSFFVKSKIMIRTNLIRRTEENLPNIMKLLKLNYIVNYF